MAKNKSITIVLIGTGTSSPTFIHRRINALKKFDIDYTILTNVKYIQKSKNLSNVIKEYPIATSKDKVRIILKLLFSPPYCLKVIKTFLSIPKVNFKKRIKYAVRYANLAEVKR